LQGTKAKNRHDIIFKRLKRQSLRGLRKGGAFATEAFRWFRRTPQQNSHMSIYQQYGNRNKSAEKQSPCEATDREKDGKNMYTIL